MLLKIVLCVSYNRLNAGVWRMGRLISCAAFNNDTAGHADFAAFLQLHPRVPIYLITNLPEEDYRVERAPHTTGRIRQRMLERKSGQIHRNTAYRAAICIDRDASGRRDDIFLLVALNNSDSLRPWIATLTAQEATLVGIYLLPMVMARMLHRLHPDAVPLLFIDDRLAGLRQSYFHRGQLCFSRLTPDISTGDANLAQTILLETEKTRRYLLSQHFLPPATTLRVLIRVDDKISADLCHMLAQQADTTCQPIDPIRLAGQSNAQTLQQFPELLYMAALIRGPLPVNLAPAAQIRAYQLHLWRRWMVYAAAALFLAGVTGTCLNLSQTRIDRQLLLAARAQTAALQEQYAATDSPASALRGSDLKRVVAWSRAIDSRRQTPQRLMQAVAAALDHVPEIDLQRLHWKVSDNPNAGEEDPQRNILPAAALELGFIDGTIIHFNGDYRAALGSIHHLIERLERNTEIASVIALAIPPNANAHTTGGTLDTVPQQAAAPFKLRIVLKPVAEK